MTDIIQIPSSPDITFRRSRRAIRMRLQIDREGIITLVAPWFSKEREIHSFVARHTPWIQKHLGRIERHKALRPTPRYRTGDTFYYFGEPLTLEVAPSTFKRPTIKIQEDRMRITLYRDIGKSEGVTAAKKIVEQFYRKKAEEVIRDRLEHFNTHYGFRFHRVAFRDQKSRWGSCSRAGNLNFNWRLIMAPIEVIDFVVVHELCHLREMNHSRSFWALVEQKVPDHKVSRKWLKENHWLLKT
jgi:predicted metal-dependent hydrolase